MKYEGCSVSYLILSYIDWSTKKCELSHIHRWPQSMYASLESSHHEDAALKCILWLIVMKCSAIPISKLRCQSFYLNHIPIRAYSMTYLTGRIITCIKITLFSCQKRIHDRKPFCEFEVYLAKMMICCLCNNLTHDAWSVIQCYNL